MRIVLAVVGFLAATRFSAQSPASFRVEETTIAQIQTAFRDGSLTCRSLVERYLARIEAHDKQGAALNAIVMTNPEALKAALAPTPTPARFEPFHFAAAPAGGPALVLSTVKSASFPTLPVLT